MQSLKTRILVPTSALVILVIVAMSVLWGNQREAELLNEYKLNLKSVSQQYESRFSGFFTDITNDLQFIATTPEIIETVKTLAIRNSENSELLLEGLLLPRLQSLFSAYLSNHESTFQIRFLDTANRGYELARIDRLKTGVSIVARDKLQYKEHRDYYQDSLKLKPGEIYFSALNLNREFGEIEKPHRPTLRVATGLFDGELMLGILIINVDAGLFFEQLLDSINSYFDKTGIETYIADQNGYWLLHPDTAKTFGFDLGHDERLQKEYPVIADAFGDKAKTANRQTISAKMDNGDYIVGQLLNISLHTDFRQFYILYRVPDQLIWLDKRGFYLQIAIIMSLTMVLLLLFQYLILKRSLKPITRLTEVAQSIAHGHYKIRLPKTYDSETAELTSAIRNLREQVRIREISLQESENRNNIVIENLPLGIVVADIDGRILRLNAHLTDMYGYEDDELKGKSIDMLASHDHFNSLSSLAARLREQNIQDVIDDLEYFEARHKNGSIFPINISMTPIILNQHNHVLLSIIDISNKVAAEKQLWHQANYDELTQLPNRKLFYELLSQEQKIALRQKHILWLLFLDLDGFKEINDTYGHNLGDMLLIEVANRLKGAVRESDVLARLGGDEFVILLTNVDEVASVERISEQIIKKIAAKFQLGQYEAFISTSIGIACFPNDADNSSDLLRFADQAMYQAKAEGKNRFNYFTNALQEASKLRMQIANDLRKAILRNELMLLYQPIVEIKTGMVFKAESLIRWVHPEKGLISPMGFIPVAEETGVIHDIGAWIFKEVFKQFDQLDDNDRKQLRISVNVSPVQLTLNEHTYDNWIEQLSTHGLTGENIIIECTEGLLLKNEPQVNRRLLTYRDHNIAIAIDDFGTGYSSLAYLKEFDIDFIKIDQSFIRNMKPASSEESLVEAIIVMAHKLGMEVIAEGVETEQQLEMLKTMQCDFAQGYLFSKPVAGEVFIKEFLHQSLKT